MSSRRNQFVLLELQNIRSSAKNLGQAKNFRLGHNRKKKIFFVPQTLKQRQIYLKRKGKVPTSPIQTSGFVRRVLAAKSKHQFDCRNWIDNQVKGGGKKTRWETGCHTAFSLDRKLNHNYRKKFKKLMKRNWEHDQATLQTRMKCGADVFLHVDKKEGTKKVW